MFEELIVPVFHGVHSMQRLVEAARASYGLGLKTFVASRAMGAAAQQGIPELHRLAYKLEKNLLVVRDLPDVVELLSPKKLYMVVPPSVPNSNRINWGEVVETVKSGEMVAFAFSGGEPNFSKKELELGEAVYVVEKPLESVGLLAITIYEALKQLGSL